MKGPKTMAAVVGTFVVLAAGFAFADEALSPQNTSVTADTTTSTEATTSTTLATTSSTAPAAPEAENETEHAVTRSTVGCPTGTTFENHGQFVSGVAKDDDPATEVEDAAHSSCGKPEHDATENENESDSHDGDHHGDDHGPSANAGSGSSSSEDHSGGHHGGGDDNETSSSTSTTR